MSPTGGNSAEDEDETYVNPLSSASNTGSHPKLGGPRAGTILPSVRPSKRIGSVPGPALYAKVQSAHAARVGKPSSMRLRPELSQISEPMIPDPFRVHKHSGSVRRTPKPKPRHTERKSLKTWGMFLFYFLFLVSVSGHGTASVPVTVVQFSPDAAGM
jgi:hypothetical protein